MDRARGCHGAPGGGRDPHGFREGLHPRRDHRVRRLHRLQGRTRREGCRQDAPGRQGLHRQGRRRHALPVQRVTVVRRRRWGNPPKYRYHGRTMNFMLRAPATAEARAAPVRRRARWRTPVWALVAVALAACSSLGTRPQAPEVGLDGITAAAVGPGGARARIRLVARNPNAYDLSVTSLDYMLTLDGRSVGGGTLVQPVTLAAQAVTPVILDVRVDLTALGTVIDRATRRGTIPYELTGDLVLGDGMRLPFHRSGDFNPLARATGATPP